MSMNLVIDAIYLLTAAVFIIGLKQMSSPVTAHRGIVWAGIAMVVASLATFGMPQISLDISSVNLQLMLVAIILGSADCLCFSKTRSNDRYATDDCDV